MLAEEQSDWISDFRGDLPVRGSIPRTAAPKAVAELQLLASSHVVDLEAITSVVRNDLGLTIHLLQLSARKLGKNAGTMSTLSEVIVQLGLEQLRRIAAEVTLTSNTFGHS